MRVLTVRQPWAWAIIHGGKDVENRTRNIAGGYRGPVAIHAAAKFHREDFELALKNSELAPIDFWSEFCLGEIIGVVDLVGVHESGCLYPDGKGGTVGCWNPESDMLCSPWGMNGVYHLGLAKPRPLNTPIPAKGKLGLWRPSSELEAQIMEQLA